MKRLLLSLLAVGSIAGAATLTYDSTPIVSTNVSFSGSTSNLQQFNPGLGTLTGVTVVLHGESDGGLISWTLDAGQPPATVDLGIGAFVTLTVPGAAAFVATPMTTGFSGINGIVDTVNNVFTVNGVAASDVSSAQVIGGGFYPTYTGAGSVLVSFDGIVNTSLTQSGGSGTLGAPTQNVAGGFARVVYTYTPTPIIPEPASIALLGLAGLVFLRRR